MKGWEVARDAGDDLVLSASLSRRVGLGSWDGLEVGLEA